ncbi:hypothetical protein BKA64DRAFT_476330 [Cadophora sp. MPI-SDFR-AT-0126]|nr:hypothetical protein BKA64DRAFT_476330 [Leotiomycetes sp. MPI-SDFR-AT-0126]
MRNCQPDIEMPPSKPKVVNGFPNLADFVSKDKDHSTAIYRSYYRLTSRNLLYLEAELFELEKKQDELDEKDRLGDLAAKRYVRDWAVLASSDDPRCIERRDQISRTRAKIKEYQDALIAQESILKMIRPHHRTVEAFQSWMDGEADGRGVAVVTGLSANRLHDQNDLISLRPSQEQDWMTRFVRRYFRVLFVEGKVEGSLAHFSETRIAYAVAVLSILLAAILLVGAIVNLYLVRNVLTRLGLVGVYTAAFSASVGILTNARRAELFASTAAYAAVLVVFVSGDLAPGGSTVKSS